MRKQYILYGDSNCHSCNFFYFAYPHCRNGILNILDEITHIRHSVGKCQAYQFDQNREEPVERYEKSEEDEDSHSSSSEDKPSENHHGSNEDGEEEKRRDPHPRSL